MYRYRAPFLSYTLFTQKQVRPLQVHETSMGPTRRWVRRLIFSFDWRCRLYSWRRGAMFQVWSKFCVFEHELSLTWMMRNTHTISIINLCRFVDIPRLNTLPTEMSTAKITKADVTLILSNNLSKKTSRQSAMSTTWKIAMKKKSRILKRWSKRVKRISKGNSAVWKEWRVKVWRPSSRGGWIRDWPFSKSFLPRWKKSCKQAGA